MTAQNRRRAAIKRTGSIHGSPHSAAKRAAQEQRRRSAKVSRQLRMLRAHGLILKVVHTHRYQLTARGRTILAALQAARQANPHQLAKLAA